MANTALVPNSVENADCSSSISQTEEQSFIVSSSPISATPASTQITSDGMSCVRQTCSEQGISGRAVDIIMASWRSGTQKQYSSYIRRWLPFCEEKSCDSLTAHVNIVIEFLTSLYTAGLSYSSINTARSALSSLFEQNGDNTVGNHHLVSRFMKGIFNLRPALRRYQTIWDVHTVFEYIRSQPLVEELDIYTLTLRLTFLLCLLSGQRRQTIKALRIDCMDVTPSAYTFHITELLKHTRPGFHQQPIAYEKYPADAKLCIYEHIKHYLKRTESRRAENKQLLITTRQPYHPASADSILWWCLTFLRAAGIDTIKFKSHSTRAASTSSLSQKRDTVKGILAAAGWSHERTFSRFYKLKCDSFNFGTALLRTSAL